MKRNFEISFPQWDGDADLRPVNWRSALHTDLWLRVGPSAYHVHKVCVGHGLRASAFLNRAVVTEVGCKASRDDGKKEVDLSLVLPEPLWDFVEPILDFVYVGDIDISEATVMKLLACSELLQICALFDRCRDALVDLLGIDAAPELLGDAALSFLSNHVREAIELKLVRYITQHFAEYDTATISQLPTDAIAKILSSNDLPVMHEDTVFEIIREHVAAEGDLAKALWGACRLRCVSPSLLRSAKEDGLLSADVLVDAMLSPPIEQRRPFFKMKCLFILDCESDVNSESFDCYASLAAHIKRRGGNVWPIPCNKALEDTDIICKRRGHSLDEDTLDASEIDVILTDIDLYGSARGSQVANAELLNTIRQLVDQQQVGLVIVRNKPVGAQRESPQMGYEYEPLVVYESAGSQDPQTQETATMQVPTNMVNEDARFVRQLFLGVRVDRWFATTSSWASQRSFWNCHGKVIPGAKVVVETACGNIPVFALHSTRRIATLWDCCLDWGSMRQSDSDDIEPCVQLLLNTLFIFGHQRCSERRIREEAALEAIFGPFSVD